jgi:hypothetical protein
MILNYVFQMMWHLVRSSWILHVSCNKRRVAPIAALLSSVLHSSVFSEENMHVAENAPGPLKWVCGLSLICGCANYLQDVYDCCLSCSLLKMFLRKVKKVLVQFVLQHYT